MEQLVLTEKTASDNHVSSPIVEIINSKLKTVPFAPVQDIREAGTFVSLSTENAHYLVLNSKIRTREWKEFAQPYNNESLPPQPAAVGKDNLWEIQPEEAKDFSVIIPQTCSRIVCPQCHGEGSTACDSCHGSGEVKCKKCGGTGQQEEYYSETGLVTCRHCDGSGRVADSYCPGGSKVCVDCNGRGTVPQDIHKSRSVPCSKCRGTGKNPCKTCSGTGKLQCSVCKGSGIILHGYKLEQTHSDDVRILSAMSHSLAVLIPTANNESSLGKYSVLKEFVTANDGEDLSMLSGDHANALSDQYAETIQTLNHGVSRCDRQTGKLLQKTYHLYSFTPENIPDIENPTVPLSIAVSTEDSNAFIDVAIREFSQGDFSTAQKALTAKKYPEAMRKGLLAMFKSNHDPEITAFVEKLAAHGNWGNKLIMAVFIVIFILFSIFSSHATAPLPMVWLFTFFGITVAWAVCRAGTCNLIWRSPLPCFRFNINFSFYLLLSLLSGIAFPFLFCFCESGNLGGLMWNAVFILVLYPWVLFFCVTSVRNVVKTKVPEPGNKKMEAKIRKVEKAVSKFAFRNPWPTFAIVFGPLLLVYSYQLINILMAK